MSRTWKIWQLIIFLISLVASPHFVKFLQLYHPLLYSGVLGKIFKFNYLHCFLFVTNVCLCFTLLALCHMFIQYKTSQRKPYCGFKWSGHDIIIKISNCIRLIIVHTPSYAFYRLCDNLLMKNRPAKPNINQSLVLYKYLSTLGTGIQKFQLEILKTRKKT